jgi:hypothetical protein
MGGNEMIEKTELAAHVEQAARDGFNNGKLAELLGRGSHWTPATAAIKKVFYDLGKKLGFCVAASGCPGSDGGEWKYDLTWYEEDQQGYTTRIPLILETELKPQGKIVDLDFVKLVAGRADVRVWLSCAANRDAIKTHIERCEEQARRFAGSVPGDTYVFIIFDWAARGDVTIETRLI